MLTPALWLVFYIALIVGIVWAALWLWRDSRERHIAKHIKWWHRLGRRK